MIQVAAYFKVIAGLLNIGRRWGSRAAFSIADQGIMSGANFTLNILLARYLLPSEYGAFAVCFSIFLFLSGFQDALILEPMSVLGPSHHKKNLPTYLRCLTLLNLELTGALALIAAFAALALEHTPLGKALWGLAVATPLTLSFWFFRRSYYVDFKPQASLKASLAYAILLIAGTCGLQHCGNLNVFWAFVVMGVAGAAASLNALRQFSFRGSASPEGGACRQANLLFREHWDYGKWIVVLALLSLLTTHLQTMLVGAYLGLDAAGVLRAAANFMLPAAHTITALSLLGLPVLSEDFGRGDIAGLIEKGIMLTVLLIGLGFVYEIALLLFREPLERLLYGGKYAAHVKLIPVLGLIPVFSGLSAGFTLVLRAAQEPKVYLIAGLATAPVGVLSPIICMDLWDLNGAAASMVITSAWGAAVTYLLYRSRFSKKQRQW